MPSSSFRVKHLLQLLIQSPIGLNDHFEALSYLYVNGVLITLTYVKQAKFYNNKISVIINKILNQFWSIDLIQRAIPEGGQLKGSRTLGISEHCI